MKRYNEFPKPIGDYVVGRTQRDLDYVASDNSKREITAFIYYPSDSNEGKQPANYMFPEVYDLLGEHQLLAMLKDSYSINIKTQCYDDIKLSDDKDQYPVVFYVCGGGGSPEWGTVLCSDLASKGYIVVSVGHQNTTMYKRKDGKLFNISQGFSDVLIDFSMDPKMLELSQKMELNPKTEKAVEICREVLALPVLERLTKYSKLQEEDVRYVADYLYFLNSGEVDSMFNGRLMLNKGMGIVGHSYGGPTTALVCRDDHRFTCGIGLDSGAFGLGDSDINKPFLLMYCGPNYNMNAAIGANNSKETFYYSIAGVNHLDFCDIVFTCTNEMIRGERDAMDMRNVITDYTKVFFDRYILGKDENVTELHFEGVDRTL
ncbi:MAG: choline esterase [Lachnospiraceae bacterium]|nr:choline esterase [Lachnospiraceae bacterium]